MRTDTSQPIRLSEYRPPAFLVDDVHLTFDLAPNATRVTARLAVRRNGEHNDPLVFNGERLKPLSVAIDGRLLDEAERTIDKEYLIIPDAPDAFSLETEVEIDPENNKALEGLYMSGGRYCTQCESEGFRKITFWPDRPDVLSKYTVRIEADKRSTTCSPTATWWTRATSPAAVISPSGTTPSPSPATCSPWSGANWMCWRTSSPR